MRDSNYKDRVLDTGELIDVIESARSLVARPCCWIQQGYETIKEGRDGVPVHAFCFTGALAYAYSDGEESAARAVFSERYPIDSENGYNLLDLFKPAFEWVITPRHFDFEKFWRGHYESAKEDYENDYGIKSWEDFSLVVGGPHDTINYMEGSDGMAISAEHYLHGDMRGYCSIPHYAVWNDAPETTHKDVMDLFDMTIESRGEVEEFLGDPECYTDYADFGEFPEIKAWHEGLSK